MGSLWGDHRNRALIDADADRDVLWHLFGW